MPFAKGLGVALGLAIGSELAVAVVCAAEVVAHPATNVRDKARAIAEADRIEWRKITSIAFGLTI
jgi:hypothetical protein